ncbi:hypothetical protein H261_00065 [Paramagnetospirillum caucaseum]|uniref:Uncharacterized protein n=1 Tax=Paramagnetospirillum caucaseum TaxID=1244869 RepID=M2YFS9_9PROT|nr:hypothetical protein [Paramagnetospirillum caucaseum]EME71926.1 hypothetical protein H261_00065 [Paramagnetospirillum caucaseum]
MNYQNPAHQRSSLSTFVIPFRLVGEAAKHPIDRGSRLGLKFEGKVVDGATIEILRHYSNGNVSVAAQGSISMAATDFNEARTRLLDGTFGLFGHLTGAITNITTEIGSPLTMVDSFGRIMQVALCAEDATRTDMTITAKDAVSVAPESDYGVVEVISRTPCRSCQREAEYTVLHVASRELAARASKSMTDDEMNELVYDLENASPQSPIGFCTCGAPGAETGSSSLAHWSRRVETGWTATDQAYQILSVRLL